jgi:hypothetical protein
MPGLHKVSPDRLPGTVTEGPEEAVLGTCDRGGAVPYEGGRDTTECVDLRSLLDEHPSSTARARSITREALALWGFGALEEVACLLVTELVADVVAHASSPAELTIRDQSASLTAGGIGSGTGDRRSPGPELGLRVGPGERQGGVVRAAIPDADGKART